MSIGSYSGGIPILYTEVTPLEFHDYTVTVTMEGQTDFVLDHTITADTKIDVEIDGRDEPIEGVNWTRDVAHNKIILSEGMHVDSVFKARIYI